MTEKGGLNPNWKDNSINPDDAIGIMPIIDAADKNYEKIRGAFRDKLTDCRNRNYFDEVKSEFEKEFDPNRSNNQVAFIFADLNNLKLVNDGMGHEKGDALIVSAAKFLKEKFRKGDHVYRVGGDEFVIVCKNTENDPNFEENLIKKTNSDEFKNSPVSMAFGVAAFDEKLDKNFDDTLRRADERMYKHKTEMKDDEGIVILSQLVKNNS